MEPQADNTNTIDHAPHPEAEATLSTMWAGLKARVLSALVLGILVISLLIIGRIWFTALVLVAALQMLREWDGITHNESNLWRIGGMAYVAVPCIALLWLRGINIAGQNEAGLYLVLFVMLVVWATDIGAYFFGRYFGGPKLAPAISPSKTWAGLAGGSLCAAGIGIFASSFGAYPTTWVGGFLDGFLLALVSQGGDLFESWLKRRAGVKDSSRLIPGHGGLLDRVDGLIAAIPVYALLAWLSGRV